jgi:hypothetical protein
MQPLRVVAWPPAFLQAPVNGALQRTLARLLLHNLLLLLLLLLRLPLFQGLLLLLLIDFLD